MTTNRQTRRKAADVLTDPSVSAARVISAAGPQGVAGIAELADSLAMELDAPRARADARMLTTQALALQALFTRLTEKAMEARTLTGLDTYMRLALRAQAQCARTLETVATITQGRTVYANNANVVQGPQQVNVNMPPPLGVGVQERANELFDLGATINVGKVDTESASGPGSRDSQLAPVGQGDRPQYVRRKGPIGDE